MTEPGDIDEATRWFASRYNNATWDWLEATTSVDGLAPTDPIIHTAHASFQHWSEVGTTLHLARAASLVANVHATVGNTALAKAFAADCARLLDEAGDAATDWDRAFCDDSMARALAATGDPGAEAARHQARATGDAIANPKDKATFDSWYEIWPWPT
jgi:hypothetical protein